MDQEDVDIMMDGLDGDSGEGRPGPAIRGPYDYAEHSATTKCWCAGVSSITCSDCDKWIDVIYKDGTYYYCNTTYYGKLYPWSTVSSAWTSGDTFDFIAANLILANNAKIKFITNNALYLMDGNDVTGGAMGGSGLNFWAGGDPDSVSSIDQLPFRVYNDGTIYAKKGVFAGYLQFPYVNVTALTHTGDTYQADDRAYIVSYPTVYGAGRNLILPVPSADLNGFTYDIIVRPRLTRSESGSDLKVSASGGTDITCYAYIEYRFSEWFRLTGGRYTITCVPDGTGSYCWAITQATGGLECWNANASQTEYLSTLLGSSYLTQGMITKVVTHSGNTSQYNSTSDNTMFVKK